MPKSTEIRRKLVDLSSAIDRCLEEGRRKQDCEREQAAAMNELRKIARDRLVITKLCRKRYYREKYIALGIWPLSPQPWVAPKPRIQHFSVELIG
jgi:hypothetical protein